MLIQFYPSLFTMWLNEDNRCASVQCYHVTKLKHTHTVFIRLYEGQNCFLMIWSWCACVIQSDISSLECLIIDKCPICNSWNWLRLCKNRFWNWAKKQHLLVEDCHQGHFHIHKESWWRTEMLLKLLGLSNLKVK